MIQARSLEVVTFNPPADETPIGQIVFLHGWGDNAQNFALFAAELNLKNYSISCPNAPFTHARFPEGRAWYDLEAQNWDEFAKSRTLLLDWLQGLEASTGVGLSQTILAGFSQGGAMTLDVGLELPLAGLGVFSGYLHPDLDKRLKLDRPFPPILLIHGRLDPIVPIEAAHLTQTFLQSHNATLTYREFDGGHDIPLEAVVEIRQFIKNTFK